MPTHHPTHNDPIVTDPVLIAEAWADIVEFPPAVCVRVYRCRIHGLQPAKTTGNGRDKIARFRTGYVARFLACGCAIPVTQGPIK